MKWRFYLLLCFMSFYQKYVHGHRVLSLLHYAEDVCNPDPATEFFRRGTGTSTKNPEVQELEMRLCKYKSLGIVTANEDLGDEDFMAFILGYAQGESDIDTGVQLAADIHEKCSKIHAKVKGKPAEEWKPFFECTSKIVPIDNTLTARRAFSFLPKGDEEEDARLKNLVLSQEEIDKIHPKLYCHKGYDNNTKDYRRGEGLRLYAYKVCKHHKSITHCKKCNDPFCIQRCIHELLGFIDFISVYGVKRGVWSSRDYMIGRLRSYFKNYSDAVALADKLLASCRNSVLPDQGVRFQPCQTRAWVNYFTCVDSIVDCEPGVEIDPVPS